MKLLNTLILISVLSTNAKAHGLDMIQIKGQPVVVSKISTMEVKSGWGTHLLIVTLDGVRTPFKFPDAASAKREQTRILRVLGAK